MTHTVKVCKAPSDWFNKDLKDKKIGRREKVELLGERKDSGRNRGDDTSKMQSKSDI